MRQRPKQLTRMDAPPVARPEIVVPLIPDTDEESRGGLSMIQVLTIARAYWKTSAMIAVTIIVLAYGILTLLPKKYTATATLIVSAESKDPLAAQQLPMNMLGNFVATQTELMTSPVILLPVVDRLGLANDPRFTAGLTSSDPKARREFVEQNLEKSLLTETGRGGQLLYVSATAVTPQLAADIPNAVADEYLEQQKQRKSLPAGERAQRYAEELAELRAKAATAQDKVTDFRKQNGMTDVAASNDDSEMQALSSLENKLRDSQSRRRTLEAKQPLQQSSTDEAMASDQIKGLKIKLNDLEAQIAEKRVTLGARHPAVVELNTRLEATRQSLNSAVEALEQNNSTELTREKDLGEKLSRAVVEQRRKVLGLHQLLGEEQKLVLELQSAQSVYKHALDGYDQIMFASADSTQNVTIISRATPPLRASKTNKLKLFAAAILLALGAGFIIPLAYELFVNRRLRCRDDLEREFGIPVLAHFEAVAAGSASV